MSYNVIPQKDRDLGRGTALLVCGAVIVLLTWTLPYVAWLAIAAYGFYRLYLKNVGEGLVALAIAVLFFFLQGLMAGLFWILGAIIAAAGLFFLIRAMRSSSLLE